MCTRYPIINRVSELKVHIELTRFVQPEKIEIDANERAVNEKSPYCFFVCTTFDSFLNDLDGIAEKNICDLVEEIAKHAIIICVSHKEELLKRSRKILVIEEGKVMDTGTHESLLNSSITYKKLYENQREGER